MRTRAFAVVMIVSVLTALLPFGVARADSRDHEGRLDVSVIERGTQTPASDYSGILSRIVSGTYTTAILTAPAVFIHGIFGDSESAFGKGDSKGIWHVLDQAGMSMYFWNYDMDYASRGIACTRVDLVGHSMGGLMARRFTLADEGYRGSPIADLVNESEHVQRFFEIIGSRVIAQHDYVMDASSAWSDLYEPNAVALGFPDDVPMYSICGNVREAVSSLTDDVVSYVRGGQTLAINKMLESGFANISVMLKVIMNLQILAGVANGAEKMINDSLFSGQEHDICVSVPSARDDFTEAYSTKYDGMDYRHDKICKQDNTGMKVLELLRGPESAFKVFASDNELEASPANLQASGRYNELIAYLVGLNIQYDGITLSTDKEVLNISRATTEQLTLSITDGAKDSTSFVNAFREERSTFSHA